MTDVQDVLQAAAFAARKHRLQKRKDAEASPYINHPLEVAAILAGEGGVTDVLTLVAAVLHDTLEDTETTPEELATTFGATIRDLVQALQAAGAPRLSDCAKLIRIADKIVVPGAKRHAHSCASTAGTSHGGGSTSTGLRPWSRVAAESILA